MEARGNFWCHSEPLEKVVSTEVSKGFPWKAQALCGFQRSFIFDFPGFTFVKTLVESAHLAPKREECRYRLEMF